MFLNGNIVTLVSRKMHGEGEHAVTLREGIVGMIVEGHPDRTGHRNHAYIVDFGPEGQWNCTQTELRAEGREAEDEDLGEDPEFHYDDDPGDEEDEEEESEERPEADGLGLGSVLRFIPEVPIPDPSAPDSKGPGPIDFEKDMENMMRKLAIKKG